MWNSLWNNYSNGSTTEKKKLEDTVEPLPLTLKVLLIDGIHRVKTSFPIDGQSVLQVRRWIHKTIARPGEQEEAYNFKVLYIGHHYLMYWYNVILDDPTYGVAMAYNPKSASFTNLSYTEQIVLPQPRQLVTKQIVVASSDNNNTSKITATPLMLNGKEQEEEIKPKRKRGRPRKVLVAEKKE